MRPSLAPLSGSRPHSQKWMIGFLGSTRSREWAQTFAISMSLHTRHARAMARRRSRAGIQSAAAGLPSLAAGERPLLDPEIAAQSLPRAAR